MTVTQLAEIRERHKNAGVAVNDSDSHDFESKAVGLVVESCTDIPTLLDEITRLNEMVRVKDEALKFYALITNYAIPPKTGQTVGEFGSKVQQDHGRTARVAINQARENTDK